MNHTYCSLQIQNVNNHIWTLLKVILMKYSMRSNLSVKGLSKLVWQALLKLQIDKYSKIIIYENNLCQWFNDLFTFYTHIPADLNLHRIFNGKFFSFFFLWPCYKMYERKPPREVQICTTAVQLAAMRGNRHLHKVLYQIVYLAFYLMKISWILLENNFAFSRFHWS